MPPEATNMNTPSLPKRERSSQACEACRKQKLACVMKDGADCERCTRLKKMCIPHVPKVPAQRRPRQPKQRTDREDSGDVEEVHRERPARRDLILEGMLPEQDWSMVMTKPQQKETPVDDFGATLLTSLGSPVIDNDISRLRKLTWKDADDMLDHYRNRLSPQWPFVVVQSSQSAQVMIQEGNAVLLLAVLTTTSYTDGELQLVCETVFRHVLAIKTFIKCETSLAVLQAVLVFLAWHHYAYRPGMVALYRNCQILVENGLNDIVCDRGVYGMGENIQTFESQRALLGCYFLCTHGLNVFGMNRGPTFLYKAYYSKCAEALQTAKQSPQDIHFVAMLELLRIVERVHTWKLQSSIKSNPNSYGLDTSFASHISQELQAWADRYGGDKRTVPGWLVSAYRYSYVYLLDPMQPVNRDRPKKASSSVDFLAHIHACMGAIHEYFDHFLQYRIEQAAFMSLSEWVHIISSLAISVRMSLLLRVHAQQSGTQKLESLIMQITGHLTAAIEETTGFGAPRMFFKWLRAICFSLDRWLRRPISIANLERRDDGSAFGTSAEQSSAFETIRMLSMGMKQKELNSQWPSHRHWSSRDMLTTDLSEVLLHQYTENQDKNGDKSGDTTTSVSSPPESMHLGADVLEDVVFDPNFMQNLMSSFSGFG